MKNYRENKILLVVILFAISHILITSCSHKKNEKNFIKANTKNQDGVLTLVFENAPEKIFISTKDNNVLGGRSYYNYLASFIDSDGITQYLNPKRKPNNDTLNISIRDPKIEIYFTQLGLEGLSYLFLNGDKVLVTYENGKPKIKVLNRPTKQYDYYFENIREHRSERGLTVFEEFFRHLSFPNSSKPLSKEQLTDYFEENTKRNSIRLLDSLIIQMKLLDSFNNNHLISKDIYDYYTNKLKYINWSRLAKLKKLDFIEKPNQTISIEDNQKHYDTIFLNSGIIDNEVNVTSILNPGDRFFQYKYYQDFLNDHFLPNYFEKQTTKYIYSYGNFGGNHYSWDVVFDTIQKSKLYPTKVKEFLLYRYMNRISKDMPSETVKVYYAKFLKFNKNSTYVDLINKDYHLDSIKTNKLTLKNRLNETYYLEDVLEENQGKLVYIDFLASWCKPCVESIPYKEKLKDDYANKNVIFISIAIDKDQKEWEKSETFASLKNYDHNYIIKNPLLSNFIKNNHVNFVPRYFIVGKTGKVLNPNAPGPDTNEIRKLLDAYLNQ